MIQGMKRENIAKGKIYKDGFYSHKYKDKFGTWPKDLHNSPKPPSIEFRNWIKSRNIRNAKSRAKNKPVDKETSAKTIADLRAMLKEGDK